VFVLLTLFINDILIQLKFGGLIIFNSFDLWTRICSKMRYSDMMPPTEVRVKQNDYDSFIPTPA
jgi:hypothetical protein